MTAPIIQVSSISKISASKPVLDQLDWQISPAR